MPGTVTCFLLALANEAANVLGAYLPVWYCTVIKHSDSSPTVVLLFVKLANVTSQS